MTRPFPKGRVFICAKSCFGAFMYRLFAALEMPAHTHQRLRDTQSDLFGAKWRPAANFHITLQFFGDVSRDQALDLDAKLADILSQPLQLSIEGTGWFGKRAPRAVWARIREDDSLRALASQCERVARRMGLPIDKHPYTPHITLAYLHDTPLDAAQDWCRQNQDLSISHINFETFHLFSSQTGGGKPSRYVAEADYVLGD